MFEVSSLSDVLLKRKACKVMCSTADKGCLGNIIGSTINAFFVVNVPVVYHTCTEQQDTLELRSGDYVCSSCSERNQQNSTSH